MSIQSLYGGGVKSWQDVNIDNLNISDLTCDSIETSTLTCTTIDSINLKGDNLVTDNIQGLFPSINVKLERPVAYNLSEEYLQIVFNINSIGTGYTNWTVTSVLNNGTGFPYMPQYNPSISTGVIDFNDADFGIYCASFNVRISNVTQATTAPGLINWGVRDDLGNVYSRDTITLPSTAAIAANQLYSSETVFFTKTAGTNFNWLQIYGLTDHAFATVPTMTGSIVIIRIK